ncbi:MAG: ATP-binding protein [bacterium]
MAEKSKNNRRSKAVVPSDMELTARPGRQSAGSPTVQDRLTLLTETNRQLKRKIFDLYTIFEISRDFNSVLDYDTLLDTFILTSLAQVSASKAAVFLPADGQSQRLVMTRGKGSGRFPDKRHYFKQGSKLLGYLTKLNRPLTTTELQGDMALRGERTILNMFHPGLAVPLIYQTRLRGVFLISDKIKGREFHMDDVEFLSVLGNQISVAIENARLYESERMAARQLQAAQQQLVQTERVAALGEMSAKVAHEINNPLGIIKNYLQLLRRTVGRQPEAQNYTDVVGQEIDRIARIVRQLLDFYRPQPPELDPVNVVSVIKDVLTLMSHPMASSGVEVVADFKPDLPLINGSAENLKQVFLNILINAGDVMPHGGRLGVEAQEIDRRLRIRITDTGPGIKAELIPRIFEPFFTTKELGRGTGLGLSVCYGIINRHGGTITYNNTDSGGCFTIELPVPHE